MDEDRYSGEPYDTFEERKLYDSGYLDGYNTALEERSRMNKRESEENWIVILEAVSILEFIVILFLVL